MTEKTLLALEQAAREPYRTIHAGRIGTRPLPATGASPAYKAIALMLIKEIRRLRDAQHNDVDLADLAEWQR